MFITHKYNLRPTKDQAKRLDLWNNHLRGLWNYYLSENIKRYEKEHKFLFFMDMSTDLPKLKKEKDWLKDVSAHALLNQCQRLESALKTSYKQPGHGFPKFKNKDRGFCSIRIDQVQQLHIKTTNEHIQVPKIGRVKWKYHRPIPDNAKIKSICITKEDKNWHVSVLLEVPDIEKLVYIDPSKAIGIDLGVASFAALSDGTKIESQNFLKKALKKLKHYQRQLKHKTKGSNNKKKQYAKIAKIHYKIRDLRNNWLHHQSKALVEKYDVICVEDLKIKELLEKKVMSRAIADQGWGIFVNQLQYKAKLRGKHVTKINTYLPSTKTCSCCGQVKKMTLADRVYICQNTSCADYLITKDRDVNAANNILFWGLNATPDITIVSNTDGMSEINACGDTSIHYQVNDNGVSMKQEATCPLGP